MQGELDRKEIMKIKNRRIVREYVKSVPVKKPRNQSLIVLIDICDTQNQ